MPEGEKRKLWGSEHLNAPHDVSDKAERVRQMFDAIAPRYELVNRVCSAGVDARWRRRAVAGAAITPDDRVLDIACGTGDFARTFADAGAGTVVGGDFSHEMLIRARDRHADTRCWCEADALRLPFRAESFSVVSCAFGVRNFEDLAQGLREMFRVLVPGGRLVILEFSRPRGRLKRWAYELYSTRIMPRAASWLSRDRTGAYRYLPRSVVSFLTAEQMGATLREVGFASVRAEPLTWGVVTIYRAVRP
jgi:demethylmenaquinone methyltransferase/2-methoxy-6-polyprenyl-1,4-benzoquinol methylase